MDAIDRNLLDAWHRVRAHLDTRPDEAASRYRRTHSLTLTRPPRAWCLVLRASDTRLNSYAPSTSSFDPHPLTLDGFTIRELCKPITIPWPGVHYRLAAMKLGISRSMMLRWIRKGRLIYTCNHPNRHTKRGKKIPIVHTPSPLDPNAPLGDPPDAIWGTLWQTRHEKLPLNYEFTARRIPRLHLINGQLHAKGWNWICPGLIDEQGNNQPCVMSPRPRPRMKGKESGVEESGVRGGFRNEEFFLPGVGEKGRRRKGGVPQSCQRGKRAGDQGCRKLYGPLPIWTLGDFLDDDRGIDLGHLTPDSNGGTGFQPVRKKHDQLQEGETHRQDACATTPGPNRNPNPPTIWHPGRHDPLRGRRTFACAACWGIKSQTFANDAGWNEFIAHVSGGLLYGHEVPRPALEAPRTRKVKFTPRPHPSPRRDQCLELLLQGLGDDRIARIMGIKRNSVRKHICTMMRLQGVGSREELIARNKAARLARVGPKRA